MKAILYYLIQVIVASGIFYAYYHFALRNKKFHHYNRFYLLLATVISIIIPFLNIPVYLSQAETDSSFVIQSLTSFTISGADNPTINQQQKHSLQTFLRLENIIYLFYSLVAAIIFSRIIFSLLKIRRLINNNTIEQLDAIKFVNTTEPGTPFSFFRWLFWNKKIDLQSESGEQIFRHELFHIEQKHSRDIIFIELLTVIFWINPFFHLIKKEIKAIHEFLADKFAVKENKHWEYAELLLMQVLNTQHRLVNPFFHNQIKRRIAMITNSSNPGYQYIRKLMAFPIAAIMLALFAFNYHQKADNNVNTEQNNYSTIDTTKPVKITEKIFDKVEIEASFPGGASVWKKYLMQNLDGSIPAKKNAPDGAYTVIVQFIVDKEGNLSDVKPLTKHGYGMEEEAVRIIKKGPKWVPATQGGRHVNAYWKQPITFIVGKGEKNFPENATINNSDIKVFDRVEISPSFPGGDAKWRYYLERNLDASIPKKNKAPDGAYTVVVQFIVDKEGYISEVRSLTNHGYGMEQEAEKVIKKGPKWIPAYQGSRNVNAYRKQPITFVVGKGEKNFPGNTTKAPSDLSEVTVVDLTATNADNKIFTETEVPPSFPGGQEKWREYLMVNINPAIPIDSGAGAGLYKVVIQFIVNTDGSLTDIKAITDHGFGMEKEAIRLISKGPRWEPAKQNGHIVKAYAKQPITFVVTEDAEDEPITKKN